MDLKLAQRLLPYAGAAIAIITILFSLWYRRSGTGRGKNGRSNDSEDGEAKVSSPPSPSPPPVKEDGFQYDGFQYDVFLSFRGPDTRMTFADLLYEALQDKGVITFIDSEKLEKGQKVDELFECIKRSRIFVPIFSRGYADSKWCLKEIAKMVECKRLIVPVFVDVEPTDVRRQTGPFGYAFSKHRKNKAIDKVEVSEWSNALKEAGGVSGYTTTNSHLGKLIQQIVKRILSEVNKTSKLPVAQHPVGLDSRIQDVIKVLEKTEAQDDVRMVGIYGMGGIGKTTLSKAVYNEISSRFDAHSFISNVREAAERPSGLVSLQKQLLGDVFNEKDATISSTSDGLRQIKERIGAKKVLFVLDDVNDVSQINELVGQLEWFCSGSRIIITTRDKRVLTSARVKQNHVYELKGLDDIQSLELFSWHAFGKKEPDAKFADLSNEVASTAVGLPLALTIFGSQFFDLKTVELWKATLKKLKEYPDKKIHERLRISFDVLDDNEKEVFLDIACFFVGQETKRATLMWEACSFFPAIAINQLIHKSLVSINNEGKFEMHDHLRDMGRKIVQVKAEETGKRSRLWKNDETVRVLQKKSGTEDVEAIELFCEKWESMDVDVENLADMSQLRMLLLQHVTLKGGYEHSPKNLKWLKWSSEALEKFSIPLHLEMLVVLDLSCSSITQVCVPHKMKAKGFHQLKVLDLSGCRNLSTCPDFASMIHLEMLSLKDCWKMSELHPSIGRLKSLTNLDLGCCESLKEVPQEVRQLTSLQELVLYGCDQITALPSQIQNVGSLKQPWLKRLDLSYCSNLMRCPDFTSMPGLLELDFRGCEKMTEVDASIGQLKRLTELDLRDCKSLKELPQEIAQLTSLTQLRLAGCCSLKEVPQQVWQLTSPQELDLSGCSKITALPSEIQNVESSKLSLLEILVMRNCNDLIRCPDFTSMPNLQTLDFSGCEKMAELDRSIGQLKRLMNLRLKDCKSLKELPQEIGQLTSLTQLTLEGCSSLKEVPQEFWQLTSLEKLDLSSRSQITALPSKIQNGEALKILNLSRCDDLMTCPDFSSMQHLQRLSFRGCKKMTELDPSIGQLKRLTELDLEDCESLKDLPQEIGQLASLEHLRLKHCSSLEEVPQQVWQLTSLEELDLSDCTQIAALPSRIQNAESLMLLLLERLDLSNCSNLIRCPDFTSMPHLQTLHLSGCEKMTELGPSIGQLKRLRYLDLEGCESLKELPHEIGQLTSLEELSLEGCSSFKEVPQEIGQLSSLESLELGGCSSLKEVPQEIGQLASLRSLDLSECSSLKEVPHEVWQLTSIRWLFFSGCSKITALPSEIQNAESLMLPLLERLDLSNCVNLIRCPEFTSMPHLQGLSFRGCGKITKLDPSIGQLKRLRELDLEGCESLKELPQQIAQLTSLKKFTLRACSLLKEVPQEVWQLTSLQELNRSGCSKITALPSQAQNAESLKQPLLEILDLSFCSDLIRCPEFTSMLHLQTLSFRGCKKMTDLDPSVGQLRRLREMDLSGCESLKELPQEIGQLTSLKNLTLTGCSLLKEVPLEVGQLTSLQELSLSGCSKITALPSQAQNAESLKQPLLEILDLSFCTDLIWCPEFTSMLHLQTLSFRGCKKVTKLDPAVGQLKRLREMDLSGCESLKELPQEIGLLTSLKSLKLGGCSSLKEVPSLPRSLNALGASDCHQLESIADVSSLKEFEVLDLRGCIRLEDIPGIGQLNCLGYLLLGGCRRLADSLFERVQEVNFQHLQCFFIPGRLINDGSSYPQSIAFILPKQFYFRLLCLYVDQSSLDNICSELKKSNAASTLPDKSVASEDDQVTQPVDSQLCRSFVRIDITTDDAQFSFPTFINGWDKNRRLPMATFARDSELIMMATQGRFKGNDVDDAQGRGTIEMRVSIDGCILLHGDLLTIAEDFDEDPDDVLDVDEILDPCRMGDNIVLVKFG